MPRKKDKKKRDSNQKRPPRPKPIIDFTIDQLNYRNTELLQTFVTGHGRILPRKYTGLPAHYQRRMANVTALPGWGTVDCYRPRTRSMLSRFA